MNIIHWDYQSVWPDILPQNKCRSQWPIFHGPLSLPYILKTVWCINIIIWDYESVCPDIWPQNKCWSLWPIFHGPMILPYISKAIWWMSVIFSDNETVWPKLWSQNKYRSVWAIFLGLVILLNIVKIIWWMNIIVGIMDQCDTEIDSSGICRSVTYILWSNDFASYLENCLMEKYCIWDSGSAWHKDRPRKIYVGQWHIFHGPLILSCILSYTWIIFIF